MLQAGSAPESVKTAGGAVQAGNFLGSCLLIFCVAEGEWAAQTLVEMDPSHVI